VSDRYGRWHSLRAHPYLTLDNEVDGAVIVLADIDTIKRSELEIKGKEEALKHTNAELLIHTEELTRFNRVAVGRELRMIDLKKEVNELRERQGDSARYRLELEFEGTGTKPDDNDAG
jgi:hypothetical protein